MKLFGVLLGALFAYAFLRSGPPSPRYLMVDDLVVSAMWLHGQELKAHGWVEAGSIRDEPTVTRFVVQKNGKRLPVVLRGRRPDTLKDLSEVVLVGRLDGPLFRADDVMMRCASNYAGKRARNVDQPFQ